MGSPRPIGDEEVERLARESDACAAEMDRSANEVRKSKLGKLPYASVIIDGNARMAKAHTEAAAALRSLAEEHRELREALRSIAEHDIEGMFDRDAPHSWKQIWADGYEHLKEIAARALLSPGTESEAGK